MTKRKGGIVSIVLAVLAIIISLLCLGFSQTAVQASAAETSLYTVRFNYTAYNGTYMESTPLVQATGENVLETEEIQCNKNANDKKKLKFQIYGTSHSGTATLSSGGYIGSNTINISVDAGFEQHTFELKNSSGTILKTSSSRTLYASSLADGLYTVTYIGGTEWKVSSPIRDHPRAVKIEASFQFRVDATKPTLSGASISTTGKYINKAFTVTASDGGSGVDKIYWMAPGAGAYSYSSSS